MRDSLPPCGGGQGGGKDAAAAFMVPPSPSLHRKGGEGALRISSAERRMFLIRCPWCGERDISEFAHGGEAHIARPEDAEELPDSEWADFLFLRNNPKGILAER